LIEAAMKMRDVMRPARWATSKDSTLGAAEHRMARYRVRHLPIVDGGQFVGLLSERDVLDFCAKAPVGADWWRAPVSVAMETSPRTAGPDDEVGMEDFAPENVEEIPIVENDFLVGTVRAADILEADIRAGLPPVRRSEVTAGDAMTEHPWTCQPGDSLVDAAKVMVDFGVRHLPVVHDGALVGMLSDRDIRTVVGDPARYVESGDNLLSVRDAMSANPITVSKDRRIRDIATELIEDGVGALPVIDAAGRLVGIISYVDALRVLAA
jgi:acetoin utilization protein AcuB